MAYFERMRDVVSEPFSPEIIRQRTAAGWRMVAIEWRRELPDAEAPAPSASDEDVPYGLRVSADCSRLEEDPVEHQVLMLMMEMLADDRSYAEIVTALNASAFRMRDGRPWNRVAVFQMVPRLIEVGPRFFSSREWAEAHPFYQTPTSAPTPPEASASTAPPVRTWRTLLTRRPRA